MKIYTRNLLIAGIVVFGVFVSAAAAQHEGHQSAPAAATAGSTSGMPKMMTEQKEISSLVDRLMASHAAMEAETDPAALKQELDEHGALLKELQTKIAKHSHRMEMMHSMMESEAQK